MKERMNEWKGRNWKTCDAGSQYRCGRVGRGIQAPSTPQSTSYTHTYTKNIENARFQLDHHGGPTRRTDGWMDKASYRVACPQLKRIGDLRRKTLTNNSLPEQEFHYCTEMIYSNPFLSQTETID